MIQQKIIARNLLLNPLNQLQNREKSMTFICHQKCIFIFDFRLYNNQINNQESKNENHKLTDYFPVRRSVRKTKTVVLEEKQRMLENIVRKGGEDGLEVS